MRAFIVASALLAAAAMAIAGLGAPPPTGPRPPPTYLVRRVMDGDTIEIVDTGGIRTRVRLRDVDAPERGEPGFEAATEALSQRVLGRQIYVTPHARDRYGRLVATIEEAKP